MVKIGGWYWVIRRHSVHSSCQYGVVAALLCAPHTANIVYTRRLQRAAIAFEEVNNLKAVCVLSSLSHRKQGKESGRKIRFVTFFSRLRQKNGRRENASFFFFFFFFRQQYEK